MKSFDIIPEGSDREGEEMATESREIWNSNKNIGTDAVFVMELLVKMISGFRTCY